MFNKKVSTLDELHAKVMEQLKTEREFFRAVTVVPTMPIQERKFSTLRPMTFEQYIGQKRHVKRLRSAIDASLATGNPIPHLAFISEAGMGKTSLAACCASALGKKALATVGSALKSMDDVGEMIAQADGGIVFIDEAHDLSKAETPIVSGLLPLLEDWVLHTTSGSRSVLPFTCIMATTSFGMLDRALRSRMGIPYELDAYSIGDMRDIVQMHAARLDMAINENAAYQIAKRSRGNPRFCLNLLRETYHVSRANSREEISVDDCQTTFDSLGIDSYGLLPRDKRLLNMLKSGPVSAMRCAAFLGMDRTTFEETVDGFLFREGYITTSSRGKKLTEKGELYVSD